MFIIQRVWMICFFIWACSNSPVFAQEEAYVIGQGDVLSVSIFAGGAVQHSFDLTVTPKGTISFPFLGEVKAEGRSVSELTEAVTPSLERDYFVDPQVIITIKDYKSRRVYLTGAVKNPGLHALEGKTTLMELLAGVGGVTENRSTFAYILRGSVKELDGAELGSEKKIAELMKQKESIQVDLKALLDRGETSKDIALQPGDLIYIPPTAFVDVAQHKIYIMGEVNNPGIYDFQEGITALGACLLAGGFAKYAAPNRTAITRETPDGNQEIIKANLTKVRKGKEKDVLLKPGDRIFVPESWL